MYIEFNKNVLITVNIPKAKKSYVNISIAQGKYIHPVFTCLTPTIKALEPGVKHIKG